MMVYAYGIQLNRGAKVYMSPYVLAFTADTVEIRMASNGSLIQTIMIAVSEEGEKIN
jgi:hypothetical protein